MADAIYRTVSGFVQFDPTERDANGQEVRDVLIQQTGSEGANIRVTIWPEFKDVVINKGDWLAANGKFTVNEVKGKKYLNLSANALAVTKGAGSGYNDVENELDDDEDLSF